MGMLSFLRAGLPLAAGARGAYLTGKYEREKENTALKRQSMLDEMKMRSDLAGIERDNAATAELNARTESLKRPAKQENEWMPLRGAKTPTLVSRFTGETKPATDAAGKQIEGAAPTGGRVTIHSTNVYNPATGMIEDIMSDGTRKVIRRATATEKAKFDRIPGDTEPKMNENTTQSYLDRVADRYIRGAGGDVQKAAEASIRDAGGLEAYKQGLGTAHFQGAAQRYAREAEADRQRKVQFEEEHGSDSTATLPPLSNIKGTKPNPGTPGDVKLEAPLTPAAPPKPQPAAAKPPGVKQQGQPTGAAAPDARAQAQAWVKANPRKAGESDSSYYKRFQSRKQ